MLILAVCLRTWSYFTTDTHCNTFQKPFCFTLFPFLILMLLVKIFAFIFISLSVLLWPLDRMSTLGLWHTSDYGDPSTCLLLSNFS